MNWEAGMVIEAAEVVYREKGNRAMGAGPRKAPWPFN